MVLAVPKLTAADASITVVAPLSDPPESCIHIVHAAIAGVGHTHAKTCQSATAKMALRAAEFIIIAP
jgi:hypothetical protein